MGTPISEAVKNMSKMYLGRILESFTKDIGPQEEGEARSPAPTTPLFRQRGAAHGNSTAAPPFRTRSPGSRVPISESQAPSPHSPLVIG